MTAICFFSRRLTWILLVSLTLAITTSALLFWLFPESYSVEALLRIKNKPPTMVFFDPQQRHATQELEMFQKTQLRLMKSQFVLQSALSRRSINQLEAVIKESDPIRWLSEELQVSFPEGTEVLEVRYEGWQDAEEMKKIVDAVLAAYQKEVIGDELIRANENQDKLSRLHSELQSEIHKKLGQYYVVAEDWESPVAKVIKNPNDTLLDDLRTILLGLNSTQEDLAIKDLARLVQNLEDLPKSLKPKNAHSGKLQMLQEDLEQLKEIRNAMSLRLRQMRIEHQLRDERVWIVQHATSTEEINTSQRKMLAQLGGIATFLVTSLGLALISSCIKKSGH